MRLYQVFNLNALAAYPYDYWGDILAESKYGQGQGFYPTPLEVVKLMAMMTLGLGGTTGKDPRLQSVCDPALGTGRMLLVSSNYSYILCGQDINGTVIKASLINFALYAPWGYRPFPPSITETLVQDEEYSDRASDALTQQACSGDAVIQMNDNQTVDIESYLDDTVHDAENQWQYEPIKKRRRTKGNPDAIQLSLFGS